MHGIPFHRKPDAPMDRNALRGKQALLTAQHFSQEAPTESPTALGAMPQHSTCCELAALGLLFNNQTKTGTSQDPSYHQVWG